MAGGLQGVDVLDTKHLTITLETSFEVDRVPIKVVLELETIHQIEESLKMRSKLRLNTKVRASACFMSDPS